jgi:hypothetical protein
MIYYTFQHDRESKAFTLLGRFVGTFYQTFGSRHNWYAGLLGKVASDWEVLSA